MAGVPYTLPKELHPDFMYPLVKPRGQVQIDTDSEFVTQNLAAVHMFDGTEFINLVTNAYSVAGSTAPSLSPKNGMMGQDYAADANSLHTLYSSAAEENNNTFLLIQSFDDTTNRASSGWGSDNSNPFQCHMPFSDGVIYLDYGGASGDNRITWAMGGKTANKVNVWVFRGGSLGGQIWFDGVKKAEKTVAITLNEATSNFKMNKGTSTGDEQTIYFTALWHEELTDGQIARLSQNPFFYLLKPVTQMAYYKAAAGGGGAGGLKAGTLGFLGVGI